MYGVALMRLAHLVGLRQVDITLCLGITSVQANHWAKGVRPIPEATVPTLVQRIAEAVKRSLTPAEGHMQIAVPAQAAMWRQPTQADLTTALRDVFVENCYRYGHARVPTLEAFLEEVRRYTALTRPQQLEGPKLEHIEKLTAARLCWFELENALLPLRRLLPDDDQPVPTAGEPSQQEQAIH
jgi:hypothetical protein